MRLETEVNNNESETENRIAEKLDQIGQSILRASRDELYFSMHFLDVALSSLIYQMDAPVNLFPSIHCLESWCCIHAAFCMKKTPRWYLPVTIVMSLCVFASTLLVKQHVFIDIIGGILVFEAGYFIAKTWFTPAPHHT